MAYVTCKFGGHIMPPAPPKKKVMVQLNPGETYADAMARMAWSEGHRPRHQSNNGLMGNAYSRAAAQARIDSVLAAITDGCRLQLEICRHTGLSKAQVQYSVGVLQKRGVTKYDAGGYSLRVRE